MRKIYVMLPCYNESENIEVLIDKWINVGKQLQKNNYSLSIVGIDDKSTDNTLEKLYNKEKQFNIIKVIEHEKNLGLGGVVKTAFHFFLENGDADDYCVLMDGDNSHDPVFFVSMLNKINDNNCDCVIASRYCETSTTLGVPHYRMLLTIFAKLYYKIILNVPNVDDYTCGYRLYSFKILKKASEKFGENLVSRRSFACMMEVLYKLYLSGCRFEEVPFDLRYDEKRGKSKMRVLNTIKESIFTAIKLRLHV